MDRCLHVLACSVLNSQIQNVWLLFPFYLRSINAYVLLCTHIAKNVIVIT